MNLPVAKAVPGVRSGLVALAVCGLLVGCHRPLPIPPEDPIGLYQNAGKREYSNGTKIYYLNTRTGQVCTGWADNDGNALSTACSAPP